jgi:chlorophyllide a reductase subunit X
LYVAHNVCSAVGYFRKLGGHVGVAGLVVNKDDGTGEAQAFAEAVGIPVLASIPANDDIRRKSANYEIIGKPGTAWADLFDTLGTNVATAPPLAPEALDQNGLLALFANDDRDAGQRLEPATLEDMCGGRVVEKPTLEVIYDDV